MEEEKYKGYTIKISQDEDAENPSEFNTDVGITYMAGSRYILGTEPVTDPAQWRVDKRLELKQEDPRTRLDEVMIEYPVYAYIHGGVALALSPFSCPWDSCQSGVIYISRKKAKEMFRKRGMSEEDFQARVKEFLEGYLRTFNQYISGEVYEYIIEDEDGEVVGGCCGFYGVDHEESGLMESARSEVDCMEESE
jgi:hypothetical protein